MEKSDMGAKPDDLQKLNENGEIGALQRIELLLWGDKELGIIGLKGRTDRIEHVGLVGMLLLIIILLVTVADLQMTDDTGLLPLLIKGLLG